LLTVAARLAALEAGDPALPLTGGTAALPPRLDAGRGRVYMEFGERA